MYDYIATESDFRSFKNIDGDTFENYNVIYKGEQLTYKNYGLQLKKLETKYHDLSKKMIEEEKMVYSFMFNHPDSDKEIIKAQWSRLFYCIYVNRYVLDKLEDSRIAIHYTLSNMGQPSEEREGLIQLELQTYLQTLQALFFYACFKTPQVKLKTTMNVFFLTQLCVFVVWDLIGLPKLNPFYFFTDVAFPMNVLGYVFGVGLTEEFAKMIPLLLILRKAKEPLIPQTMVFYGLMSGIAFGVFEGVQYQITVNAQQTYDVSFFLNIARLTSLPFLHACWCGIAGYFLSFANLYPKYRRGLYTLALSVPAVIHGLYDALSNYWLVSLIMVFVGLMLLTVYLKQSVDYQSKLRQ